MALGASRFAVYVLAIADDALLLARIAPGYPGAGMWTLPGGGVEWGEHPEDALHREVFEETGLRLGSVAYLGIDSQVYERDDGSPPLHAIRILYTTDLTGEPRVVEEQGSVDRAAWVPLHDLVEVPTTRFVGIALERAGIDVSG